MSIPFPFNYLFLNNVYASQPTVPILLVSAVVISVTTLAIAPLDQPTMLDHAYAPFADRHLTIKSFVFLLIVRVLDWKVLR